MTWPPEYRAFVGHVSVCYDCRAARPRYCVEAVRLHANLRGAVIGTKERKPERRRPR